MTVADSGPIIAFARIGHLELLHEVLGEILVPEAVYREVVVRGRARPGASEVAESRWIHRTPVTDQEILNSVPLRLHPGEREAIALAQELGESLLIDEIRGRTVAQERGIDVLGSLAILTTAKRSGLIERITPILDSILTSGYWMDADLVAAFLEQMEEASDQAK